MNRDARGRFVPEVVKPAPVDPRQLDLFKAGADSSWLCTAGFGRCRTWNHAFAKDCGYCGALRPVEP